MFVRHAGSINLFAIRTERCNLLKIDLCTHTLQHSRFSCLFARCDIQ